MFWHVRVDDWLEANEVLVACPSTLPFNQPESSGPPTLGIALKQLLATIIWGAYGIYQWQ